jgi:RNA polymerase sigma factor (sigma-70 family)
MNVNDDIFNKLLARLEPNLPTTEARYKQLRLKMTKYFEWKHCEDAEGLADEAIARTVNSLMGGKEILADNPYFYIYAVARNIYKEQVRKQIKNEKLLDGLSEQSPASKTSQDCIDECLQKLPPDKLNLLQQYYFDVKGRETLAQGLNMSVNALRLQIHRLKKELRACYDNCRKRIS